MQVPFHSLSRSVDSLITKTVLLKRPMKICILTTQASRLRLDIQVRLQHVSFSKDEEALVLAWQLVAREGLPPAFPDLTEQQSSDAACEPLAVNKQVCRRLVCSVLQALAELCCRQWSRRS